MPTTLAGWKKRFNAMLEKIGLTLDRERDGKGVAKGNFIFEFDRHMHEFLRFKLWGKSTQLDQLLSKIDVTVWKDIIDTETRDEDMFIDSDEEPGELTKQVNRDVPAPVRPRELIEAERETTKRNDEDRAKRDRKRMEQEEKIKAQQEKDRKRKILQYLKP